MAARTRIANSLSLAIANLGCRCTDDDACDAHQLLDQLAPDPADADAGSGAAQRDSEPDEGGYPPLQEIRAQVCAACLAREGSECHTPGCLFWLCSVEELPPNLELYVERGVAGMLAEFHAALGQNYGDGGTDAEGRADMQAAETEELRDELLAGNQVGIARELADVVYVAYGTAFSHGIDLDAVTAEVHRANMAKRGPDGTFIVRVDGKVLKPDGWTPPDVAAVLAARSATQDGR